MTNELKDQIQAYIEWRARYQWEWKLDLYFRKETSKVEALATFARWIELVCDCVGTERFCWIRALHFDDDGTKPHFHVLMGGVEGFLALGCPTFLWIGLGGRATGSQYELDEGFANYIFGSLGPDSDPDTITFFGITGDSDAKKDVVGMLQTALAIGVK